MSSGGCLKIPVTFLCAELRIGTGEGEALVYVIALALEWCGDNSN